MCMKNINITTTFFDEDLSTISGLLQFGKVIDTIVAIKDFDGEYFIDTLTIATFLNALSSKDDPELNKKYDLLWTFGKIKDEDFDYMDIATVEYDTAVNKVQKVDNVICRSFSNQTIKFTLRNHKIDDLGRYYLKVYIKEPNEESWQIQAMNSINVTCEK